MVKQVYPCGECYCGCGEKIADPTGFFVQGHDRKASAEVIAKFYGTVAAFAVAHGFGPKSQRERSPEPPKFLGRRRM